MTKDNKELLFWTVMFIAALAVYCWQSPDASTVDVKAIHAENAQHARERAAAIPAGFETPADFPALLAALGRITKATPVPFVGERDHGPSVPTDAMAFAMPTDVAAEALADTVAMLVQSKNMATFAYASGAGIGQPYVVAVPRADLSGMIEAVGTSGGLTGPDPKAVAEWLRGLAKEQPFVVTGIGRDKIRGWFRGPVRDAASLARRFNDFCPDIVRQGAQSVDRLEVELRESGFLYCWWD